MLADRPESPESPEIPEDPEEQGPGRSACWLSSASHSVESGMRFDSVVLSPLRGYQLRCVGNGGSDILQDIYLKWSFMLF